VIACFSVTGHKFLIKNRFKILVFKRGMLEEILYTKDACATHTNYYFLLIFFGENYIFLYN
jgi:hypothetical protein